MSLKRVFAKDQNFWNAVYTGAFALFFLILMLILWQFKGELPTYIGIFDFIIIILATFRLIRLFVYDKITFFFRDFFSDAKEGPRKTMGDLLSCPWCFGVWCALVISFFYFLTPIAWFPIMVLAVSGVASFVQIFLNLIGWKAESAKVETLDKASVDKEEVGR